MQNDKVKLQELENLVRRLKPVYLQASIDAEYQYLLDMINNILRPKANQISDSSNRQYFLDGFERMEEDLKNKLSLSTNVQSISVNKTNSNLQFEGINERISKILEKVETVYDEQELSVLKSYLYDIERQINVAKGQGILSSNDFQIYMEKIEIIMRQIVKKEAYFQIDLSSSWNR